ncbi:MAG: YqeG family HAD IIIA-type phosphatase [Candidatus Cohnella colombiensis]|uniref:YqeG family HAD IIIA-type phosphatase n=1 Tax=Candidatus Cohnella colombiensis TaxID=3121368 RepID=A0AA95JEC5_9BACL|nr:MAG: YqeG family HAD IIIA-type phosphatase [Cohnella sp.]
MFKRLLPDQIVNTVYDIDLDEWSAQGVRGIITDLDNTLVSARTPLATPELIQWLDRVHDRGFKVVILSNNNSRRVAKFAEPLGLPYIPAARKPAGAAFRQALQQLGLAPQQVVVVGDQLMTDVLGGHRAGLKAILVTPIARSEEGWRTRINRVIEKVALSRLRKQGLWPKDKGGR